MGKKTQFRRNLILPALGLLLLIFISAGLLFYCGTLQMDLQVSRYDTLMNVMEQQRFTLNSKLHDQRNAMKIYADFIGYTYVEDNDKGMISGLNLITKHSTFRNLSFVLPNGDALENTNIRLNIGDREYFQRTMKGETVIGGPVASKINGEQIVTVSTPVLHKGEQIGGLVGIYNSDSISELLMPTFNGRGYTYVTTTTGEIIFKTKGSNSMKINSNLFDLLDGVHFSEQGVSSNTIRESVANNSSGYTNYNYNGEKRFICYTPVGINDWYILSVAPERFINPQSLEIMYRATGFMLFFAVLAIIAFLCIYRDQQKHMRELHDIAFVDTLTGAPNKKQFELTADAMLLQKDSHYAFAIMDIDKFKVLNDTLGYQIGDKLLVTITKILEETIQEKEICCRYGSDEFYIMLNCKDDAEIYQRIQSIFDLINLQFQEMQNDNYNLVLCCGVCVITNPSERINSISDRARHAHSLIKGKDESGITFYNEEIRKRILQEKFIESKMHDALRNEEFLIYLQPKYYLADESVYGAEALVRWVCGDGAMIYPDDFIPLFERNGFIVKLDMYMLEKACQTIRDWLDAGIEPIPISINFSRLHLRTPSFVDDIAEIVQRYDVPKHLIEVELTESTMLNNEDVLINILAHLHEHGFTLSMDDFGSGYSSLGLLKNLPVDVIKLDRTFFIDYCEIKRAVMVVAGILSMASNLGIKTVAEGVETKEQVEFLRELGCDIVQGYYYARPMPALELTDILLHPEGLSSEDVQAQD